MAVVGRAVFGELSGAKFLGLSNIKNGMANIAQSSANSASSIKPHASTFSAFAHPKAPSHVPSGIKSPMKRMHDLDLFENDLENVGPLETSLSPKKVKTNFGLSVASPRLNSVTPLHTQRAPSNTDIDSTLTPARSIRIPVSPKKRSYTLEAAVAAHTKAPLSPAIKILETSTIWSPHSKTSELKAAWKKASAIVIYEDTQYSFDKNMIQHEMAQVALDKSRQKKNYDLEAVENMKISDKLLSTQDRAAKVLAEARAARERTIACAKNGGKRKELGELDPAGFYGPGLDASSHVVVESDASLENRIAGAMARNTHEQAKKAANTMGFSIVEDPLEA